jgi:hypothetical protein
MNSIDPELEALYRQASKSEASTRADREAVRAALGVAGVALATSTATVAAGATVTAGAVSGAATAVPLVTAGKVATWLSLGAILGTTSSVLVVVGARQLTPSSASSVRTSASVQMASRPPAPRQRREGAALAYDTFVESPRGEAVAPRPDEIAAPRMNAVVGGAERTSALREPPTAIAVRPSMAGETTPSSAMPSVSSAMPSVSSAMPSVSSAMPSVSSAMPSVSSAAPSLIAESRALELVQGALARGESKQALALLAEQDSAFASGSLGEERAAARVLAWCALGRQGEVERARARFVTNFPDSPLTKRVLNCGR